MMRFSVTNLLELENCHGVSPEEMVMMNRNVTDFSSRIQHHGGCQDLQENVGGMGNEEPTSSDIVDVPISNYIYFL